MRLPNFDEADIYLLKSCPYQRITFYRLTYYRCVYCNGARALVLYCELTQGNCTVSGFPEGNIENQRTVMKPIQMFRTDAELFVKSKNK